MYPDVVLSLNLLYSGVTFLLRTAKKSDWLFAYSSISRISRATIMYDNSYLCSVEKVECEFRISTSRLCGHPMHGYCPEITVLNSGLTCFTGV